MHLPQSYDEWLTLTDEQREMVKSKWNAYNREGVGFLYCAAGRLAISSPFKVHEVAAGTYHGGEWVIHAYVDDDRIPALPDPFNATFEGFRVYWMPVSALSKNSSS